MSSTHSILRGRQITREQVLDVLARIDSGVCRVEDYGYQQSRRWHLRHNGRSYPSKAVLGIACRLHSSEFFGGVAETTRVLSALGFELRCADMKRLAPAELVEVSKQIREVVEHVVEEPWTLDPAPAAYFASGSNRPAEIRGLGWAGADIGVVATELSEAAVVELEQLAGTDVAVFVDSGAFSEVQWNEHRAAGGVNPWQVVKPIGPEGWEKILSTYERLARALGDQLLVVAPDRVGDQRRTLDLLRTYGGRLQALHNETGCKVLVPIQKGEFSQVEFADTYANEILGRSWWTPAMPCKKAATTPEELAHFVKVLRPRHVHLLGLGVRNRNGAAYAAAFAGTDTSYSMDSCWIAANVGRSEAKPRRFTAVRDAAARLGGTALSTIAMFVCFAHHSL